MACLIRMLLDKPERTHEHIDIFISDQTTDLPNLIKKLETNDNETSFEVDDLLISEYETLDKNEHFSKFYPIQTNIKIDNNQVNIFCIESISQIIYKEIEIPSHYLQIWHMTNEELNMVKKYHNTGFGISLDRP